MVSTYYMQVLSLGVLWTFFHCSGMCGPLVAGLTSRTSDPPGWRGMGRRAKRVLAYQLGRGFTYAVLGACAGIAGAMFEGAIHQVAAVSGFLIAPVLAVAGLSKVTGRRPNWELGEKMGAHIVVTLRALRRSRIGRGQLLGATLSGLVLGLLPCALMFWTLGIAATTESPLHGAGVMLTLVLLTTPTLLVAGCAAGIWRIRWSQQAVGIVLLASSMWMLLVALAANDIIAHAEFPFRLFGEPYMLMLF